ncbi:MAG TPA: hypothetical protein VN605_02515 [Thermoanaerobaculia bacterium]|nr:hypothetical protein [Thermoanaerobaculia bacterium]
MNRLITALAFLLTASAALASNNAVLIPAAGHLDGAGGTSFRSDIAIHNLRDTAQRVRLEWLPRSGVQPVLANDDDDLDAKLVVSSRIWSPQPGGGDGTVSQSFPPIPLAQIDSNKLAIGGVRRDDRFRLNVGIVNMDRLSPQRFRIHTAGIVPGDPGEGRLTLWTAYASNVDNITGDSWSSIGINTVP